MGGGRLGAFDAFGVRGRVGGRWTGQTRPDGRVRHVQGGRGVGEAPNTKTGPSGRVLVFGVYAGT